MQHQQEQQPGVGQGSSRGQKSKLIELIQGESSRTSSKPGTNLKQQHSSSDSNKKGGGFQESSSYGHQASKNEETDNISLKLEDIIIQDVDEEKLKLNQINYQVDTNKDDEDESKSPHELNH